MTGIEKLTEEIKKRGGVIIADPLVTEINDGQATDVVFRVDIPLLGNTADLAFRRINNENPIWEHVHHRNCGGTGFNWCKKVDASDD